MGKSGLISEVYMASYAGASTGDETVSIEHLKKQAKRLSNLLPDHLKAHENPAALSACQELIAKVNGYPNFHALSIRHQNMSDTDKNQPGAESREGSVQVDESAEQKLPIVNPPRSLGVSTSFPASDSMAAEARGNSSSDVVPCVPWMLEEAIYDPSQDAKKHVSGHISEQVPPGKLALWKYWIVEFGVEVPNKYELKFVPLRAMVVAGPSFLARSDIRNEMISKILNDISRKDPLFKSPEMFISIVENTEPKEREVGAVCFPFLDNSSMAGVVLEGKHSQVILNNLESIGVLRPYERYCVNAAYRKTQRPIQQTASEFVYVYPKEDFQKILSLVHSSAMTFYRGRSIGLKVSLERPSWLYDAIADLSQYKNGMYGILAMVDAISSSRSTPEEPKAKTFFGMFSKKRAVSHSAAR